MPLPHRTSQPHPRYPLHHRHHPSNSADSLLPSESPPPAATPAKSIAQQSLSAPSTLLHDFSKRHSFNPDPHAQNLANRHPSPRSSTSTIFSSISSSPAFESFSLQLKRDANLHRRLLSTSYGAQSPIRRSISLLSNARRSRSAILLISIAAVLCLKTLIGLASYSGYRAPPLFGDLEAQRHWMALTLKIDLKQWYSYDLQYWGLDYPPLTAYHSLLLGHLANWRNPAFVSLRPPATDPTGWGQIHDSLKLFLRMTVLGGELLIWIPAVCIYHFLSFRPSSPSPINKLSDTSWKSAMYSILVLLLNPNLILIDNGHFQFNSIMLGLTLAAVTCFHTNKDVLGAMLFVCSLGFKQMALYYSPAIFAYLFGKCLYLGHPAGSWLFVKLGIVSTLTLLAIFSPFILAAPFPATLHQAVRRIFPLGRGIFEDKVANFWCALNVLVKIRTLAGPAALANLALLLTFAAVLPGTLAMIWLSWRARPDRARPEPVPNTLELLPFTLFNSAMAFYLFSFQVHEKTILLPVLPLLMIVSRHQKNRRRDGGRAVEMDWQLSCLISNVAMFSMWPLLRRDGLSVQYIALLMSYNHLIGYNPLRLLSRSTDWVRSLAILTLYGAMASLHLLELAVAPPARLPDLFVVGNVALSCGVFGGSYVWSLARIWEEAWSMAGFRSDGGLAGSGEWLVPSDGPWHAPKRATSLQPSREQLLVDEQEEEPKARSMGAGDAAPRGRLLDNMPAARPQRKMISSPSGEKLMHRIKNRYLGGAQKVSEREQESGKRQAPEIVAVEGSRERKRSESEGERQRGEGARERKRSESEQECKRGESEWERKKGESEWERKKGESEWEQRGESEWELAVRNSREEAVRRRREELRSGKRQN